MFRHRQPDTIVSSTSTRPHETKRLLSRPEDKFPLPRFRLSAKHRLQVTPRGVEVPDDDDHLRDAGDAVGVLRRVTAGHAQPA
jgi:hypothetical protein